MGKTKTKIIDDSLPVEEPKAKPKAKKADDLVAKINAELGVKEESTRKVEGKQDLNAARGDSEEGVPAHDRRSEAIEDVRRDTELVGPRAKQRDERASSKKPAKAKPRSKKYQEAVKDLDRSKAYPLNEALDLAKKASYSKFDGTLEAHINTIQTGIRGLVSLPFASGKKLRILAFGKGAEDSGADIVGTDETIEQIGKGKINFDLLITTPEWMPKLARVAKNLGPRGLMPNPKSGTITQDLKKAIELFQSGKTEYKTEAKAPVIHLSLGKVSQPTEELSQNVKTLLQTIGKTRVRKLTLAPTMGPSVKVDLTSI